MRDGLLEYFAQDGALLRRIDEMDKIGSVPRKSIVFMEDTRLSFLELINEWVPEKYSGTEYVTEDFDNYRVANLEIKNKEVEKSLYKCPKCEEKIDRDELLEHGVNTEILLVFSKNEEDPIFYLITNEGSSELKRDLHFFNALYPLVSRVGNRTKQIREVLEDVAKHKTVKVTNYVAKRLYGKDQRITEHHFQGTKSIREAFEGARKSGTWIDSIECEIGENRVRLARNGINHFYGDYAFSDFLKHILSKLIRKASERYDNILKGRARTRKSTEVKSIIFEAERSVFGSVEAGEELMSLMRNIAEFEIALVNSDRSQPELMVKDYSSGGSFNVDVVSNRKIVISPQTQITEISLNCLINKLQKRYEGEIYG